jgi:hypothetical protein
MTAYLPPVRFRVDWDNDSYLNGAVPTGTPQNRFSNAAYAAGAKAAYVINSNYYDDGEFKEVDELGFTAFNADFATVDALAFGAKRLGTEKPMGKATNLFNFEDTAILNKARLVNEVSKPHEFNVYQQRYTFTTTGSSSQTDNNHTDTIKGLQPNTFYAITCWVRAKWNILSGTLSLAQVSSTWNGNGGGIGGADVGFKYSNNTTPATDNDVYTDWVQITTVSKSDTLGRLFVQLSHTMTQNGTATVRYDFQVGGLIFTEAQWLPVTLDNTTSLFNSNFATFTWNGSLGTTGGFEYRTTLGGAGGQIRIDLDHVANKVSTMLRLTATIVQSGSSQSVSVSMHNKNGTGVFVGSQGTAFDDLLVTTTGTPQTITQEVYWAYVDSSYSTLKVNNDLTFFMATDETTLGHGFDIYDFTIEVLDITDEYYVAGEFPLPFGEATMESGNEYNVSFYLSHDGAGTNSVDATVYGITVDTGELVILETATLNVVPERTRYHIPISTVAADYGILVTLEMAATDILTIKAMQLTEGIDPVTFSVGAYADLDDITQYVKTAQWKSGRNKFDEPMAYEGTMDIVLNNDSRYFSIENVDSPYFGLLRQNIKILFEVQHDFVWYPMWTGWVRYFDIVAGRNSNREVSLSAEQGVYRLREGSFSYAPTEDTRMDDVVKAIIANSGWRSAKSPFHTILSFDGILGINTYLQSSDEIFSLIEAGIQNLSLVGMDWGKETSPDEALKAVLDAENAKMWIDREGGLVLRNRRHVINGLDSFYEDLTLDLEVQDASYNHGEGIINRVIVFYEEKKEVTNAVIWQSKTPLYIPKRDERNIYRKSTIRFPLHFTFEEKRQRTITKIKSRIADFDVTVRNAADKTEVTGWEGQVWISVTSDGGNNLEVQLRNNFDYPVEVDLTIYGNYLEGGQAQTVVIEDKAAQEYIQAIHEEKINTSVLSDLETSVSIAKWILSRNALPQGEFRVIETDADTAAHLLRMINWPIGTVLRISELQTGETDRYHIIIAEEGSYAAGDTFRLTHRLARIDQNYYNRVGYSTAQMGTLNHSPEEDITEAAMFGADGGEVKKVSYLSSGVDDAIAMKTRITNGTIWFGNSGAMRRQTIDAPNQYFYQYPTSTNMSYLGVKRSYHNYKTTNSAGSNSGTLSRHIAFCNANPSLGTPKRMKLTKDALYRFSAVLYGLDIAGTNHTDMLWDMDTVDNINSGTVGTNTKTIDPIYTAATAATGYQDTNYSAAIDYTIKAPSNPDGLYVRLSRRASGGVSPAVSSIRVTDPTMIDMNKLNNSALKQNTEYVVSLWAGVDLGETVDVDVIIVEHDTGTEHTVSLSVSTYGLYSDTFTTTATLDDTQVSVYFKLKDVDTTMYVTGFAITEEAVTTIDEANVRQPLAAYLFV